MAAVTVASFYRFFPFPECDAQKAPLLARMRELGMRGTILLAKEGINGTIAGTAEAAAQMIAMLRALPGIGELDVKESTCDEQPFGRSFVKVKKEIIKFGYPLPADAQVGQHVDGPEWNRLIQDKDVLVLDSRNDYEVHVGSFERAVNPDIHSFTELKDYISSHIDPKEHPRVATFCTGGVRCEKLSAWMLEQGFEKVYQLRGGILKYLEDTPEAESLWNGECYVFDERVAVTHTLAESEGVTMCPACGHALKPEDRSHPDYTPEISCPFCA